MPTNQQTKTTFTISIGSETVITGYNPENAFMDNPSGAYYADAYFLVATDAVGYRFRFGKWFTPEAAENAINAPYTPPVFMWDETYPEYGSIAYEESNEEANVVAWEKDIENSRSSYMFKMAGER